MKLMSSKIYLRNVRFHAFHGVLPQEGIVGNDYLVNLVVDYDFSSAMKTDDLQGTLNYAEKEALKENQEFVRINNVETLAQVFTDIRYTKKDCEAMSIGFLDALKQQGFLK